MGQHRIPLYRSFQRLMWVEMASDPVWADELDRLSGQMKKGESWPAEKTPK